MEIFFRKKIVGGKKTFLKTLFDPLYYLKRENATYFWLLINYVNNKMVLYYIWIINVNQLYLIFSSY